MKGRRILRPNCCHGSLPAVLRSGFNEGPENSPAKLVGAVAAGAGRAGFNEGPENSPAKPRPRVVPHAGEAGASMKGRRILRPNGAPMMAHLTYGLRLQ